VSVQFGAVYSDAYDLLYSDKDYASECDLIERLFQRYSAIPVSSVVDFGCGTGNHVFGLSSRGYNVVGVDRSEHMLAVASDRLSQTPGGQKVRFEQGDIRSIDLKHQFDAAVIMFAVLGYQTENRDVLATLKTARNHLKPGALLVFDVWYGPAVLHQRPSNRIKVIPTRDGKILRASSGELDVPHHSCTVRFHLWQLAGGRLVNEIEETHLMRYFFPLELSVLLECSGFSLVRLGAFPEIDQDPDENTWSVIAVGRAE
jgi:SAM-dependent methyltransferase